MIRVHCTLPIGLSIALEERWHRLSFQFLPSGVEPERSRSIRLLDPSASLVVEEPRLTLERRERAIERLRNTGLRRVELGADRDVFRGLWIDSNALRGSSTAWVPHDVAVAAWGRLVRERSIVVVWSDGRASTVVASRRGVLEVRETLAIRRRIAGLDRLDRPLLWLGDRTASAREFGLLPHSHEVQPLLCEPLNEREQLGVGACMGARLPGVIAPSASQSWWVRARAKSGRTVRFAPVAGAILGGALVAAGVTEAELQRRQLTEQRDALRAQIEHAQSTVRVERGR